MARGFSVFKALASRLSHRLSQPPIAISNGATSTEALALVFGLCGAGSLVVLISSRLVQFAGKIITPIVTGTVVTLIGLTLIEVGIINMGGGFAAKGDGTFASLPNLGLAGLVIAVIVFFNGSRIPFLRMLSIVLGLLAGYIAAFMLGKLDLSTLSGSSLLTVPIPFRFGIAFDWSLMLPFLFMYLITVMESIGDLTATSSLTGQPISGPVYFQRLRGGLLADGINSLIGACLNSFPSTTFAQNNGIIQLTGVGSRHIGVFIGGMLMALGLIPAVGALVQALPAAALGGATLIMFGTVAASGIRILSRISMTRRNSIILALSLGLGLGVTFEPDIVNSLPPLLKNIFSSGIAAGGLCALVLNIALPGDEQ